ncbi:MAG: DNA-directed RNA polymerase subunit D [archaeon]|jgi:DNA-directed RNA polymerase subunit D|nr:DNA-directed RNA polymerase subunit D [archaeon]MDD2477602.1 DNA-directed RNA polymerase subunit D [Candidatus ainarchaeum sp.]MDD3084303.1 DNA-directed RNA polymerase subunit D [Candidatus ainarchaeum sp.]MDD4221044.1 DNA-directed RNA polymerase subunit D [Candidatus ainarchaeum sp.]MDD4662516.1 DNA-directed RNA polymerase subunit D [Candidatus ainarchaeum sp.]
MVRIKFLENDGKVYRYLLENTDYSYLNAIRRIITYLVPTYGIDEIDFFENDSVVVDEMLANRIGLCPINTPLVNTGKKVTFKLEEEGPKTVYSKDFISNDPEIKMVYDTIPLTKLNEGERLKLEAYANVGSGREHVKYSPAIVSYAQVYDLEITRGCESCKACFERCLVNSIKQDSTKQILLNPKDYDYCVSCAEKCDKKCLKINSTNNYILTIELIGQNSINDLLKLTERYLVENIGVFKKKIK